MYRTVLVPLDHTADADPAVAHGAAIARQVGAELELLTVKPSYVGPDTVRDRLLAVANRHGVGPPNAFEVSYDPEVSLLMAARRQGTSPRLRIAGQGDPAAVIVAAAADPETLICLRTHARGPLSELVLGSVSEQVVRAADHPVLLIGPHCEPAPEHYRSIVAALDGSELAEQILPTVVDWAAALDLTPWLFQVLSARTEPPTGGDLSDSAYVHRVADRLRIDHGMAAEWDTVHDRRPAAALVGFAATLPAAIVALSTRGRSGYGRLAMGSVALAVAHRATVPVLTRRSR